MLEYRRGSLRARCVPVNNACLFAHVVPGCYAVFLGPLLQAVRYALLPLSASEHGGTSPFVWCLVAGIICFVDHAYAKEIL